MRVLITGSREWVDRETMLDKLARLPMDTTVVHGDARGADKMAGEIATYLHMNVEAHPADWKTHGRRAGMVRNQAVVNMGADLVLAFPTASSRGTWHCVEAARAAGLRVEIVTECNDPIREGEGPE